MKFTYMKTPLYRYTFKNKRIRSWVEDNVEGLVLNLFAGQTLLNCPYGEVRIDLDEGVPADYYIDALEFCADFKDEYNGAFGTILLDPPYSYRKSMEMYGGRVASPFNRLKDAIVPLLSDSGIVITFGYHSVSMGKKRGFKQEHLLVMSHGGAIHDTLAIIERKEKEVKGNG